MKDPGRVAVLGDANIDVLLELKAYPPPGGEARAKRMTLEVGGSAANTAFSLARLGIETLFLGCLGKDHWGDTVHKGLRKAGLETRDMQMKEDATGLMVVAVTPDGERTLMGSRGANVQLDPGGILPEMFTSVAALHLSGYALIDSPQRDAALRAAELAQDAGAWVSLDVGHIPAASTAELIRSLLPGLKILVLDGEASRALIGPGEPNAAAAALRAAGAKRVGLTRGAAGAIVADEQDRVEVPALPAISIDATGAGDAFAAGMILSVLRGLATGPTAVIAAALGSLATTRWGAGTQMPGMEALVPYLKGLLKHPPEGVEHGWIEQALSGVRSR